MGTTPLRLFGLVTFLAPQALGSVSHVILEQLPQVPTGWIHSGTPDPSTQVVLQVAVTQQNIPQLESQLLAVSDPKSAAYGKYLDIGDVQKLFGASTESITAVTSWLESSAVTNYTTKGDDIWFQANVSTVNSMLGTNFSTYTDSNGVSKIRTTQYSIPQSLQGHIDLISPTTYFGKTKAMRAVPNDFANRIVSRQEPSQAPPSCNISLPSNGYTYTVFSPDCLKTEYGIGTYTPSANSGSKIAFGSFLNQSASFSDQKLFEQHFNIPIQNFSVVLVNPQDGATALPQPPSDANDGEANLDSQTIVSLVHPLPMTEYITAGSPPYFPDPVEPAGTPNENEPYLQYYTYLLSLTNAQLPQVITNSYADEEQTVPQAYAIRVCNLIGQLGLRGISILHSSGDEGVGASCLTQDGKSPQFNPFFPNTCPWVTSVGGTVNFSPESAWKGSSGGFSNYFSQPAYQAVAVGTYLSKVSPATKKYYGPYVNFTGRGFPDVSAHSVDPFYPIYQGGVLYPNGGTSAATPVVASIIALLNDHLLRSGRPALGFLNPRIYASGGAGFTDITTGQSIGCNGNNTQTGEPVPGAGIIPGAHWNATVGWDPVTGFGVPNFQKLLSLLG